MTLDGFRPVSINKLLGDHYSVWRSAKRNSQLATNEAVMLARHTDNDDSAELFAEPIEITITTYFGQRPQDADNPMSKWIIDTLSGVWYPDDAPEFVTSVTHRSRVDADRPRVVVEGAVAVAPF